MNPEDERDKVWRALHATSDRITELEATVSTRNEMMRESILSAVREAMPSSLLSDDEHRWVKLAIEKEAQSIAYRKKVIEHTTTGLVWAAIVGLGYMVREWAVAHGLWKP